MYITDICLNSKQKKPLSDDKEQESLFSQLQTGSVQQKEENVNFDNC